jgi:hypothetical protein
MPTSRTFLGNKENETRQARRCRTGFRKLAVVAAVGLALLNVAGRKDIGGTAAGRAKQPGAAPQASTAPTVLTKSIAVDALIDALAISRSPSAEKSLEQMITGEIPFGSHAKQAAQAAMLTLAARPTPEGDAFLLKIFSEPDETIRPGDTGAYPAADLRDDTAHVLAKIGSPSLRLALAKLYIESSTPPAVRSAIEKVIRTPTTANFAAQVELFRSAGTPDLLKAKLQRILVEKNTAAMKLALKIEAEAAAPKPADGSPFSPAGNSSAANPADLFANATKLLGSSGTPSPGKQGLGLGAASANGAALQQAMAAFRSGTAAAGTPAGRQKPGGPQSTPAMMMLDILGQMQNMQPIEPGMVARDLWNPEFVEAIAKNLGENSADSTAAVNALASVPTKLAREKLKDVLHKDRSKGPQDFAKMETVAADTPAAGASHGRRAGRNKKDDDGALGAKNVPRTKGSFGMQNRGATKQEVVEFGKDWYDPGSLVVLKMVVPYAERPPEKAHHNAYMPNNNRMSPAMEKRMHDKAEKQKAVEATYEWRDAIEKTVRQWDARLDAVAEAPADAGDKPSGDDEKTESGAAKTDKAGATTTSKTTKSKADLSKTDASKPGPSKNAAAPPVPNPSVAMAFALHPGGTIAKEYHLRWPQDAAATFGSTATAPEPLTVDYVRLQGTGDYGKALVHYRNAITAIPGPKAKIVARSIENGKWLDAFLKDDATHRTRTIDVIVTREQSDDDSKKSKDADLTVEVLLVEIETPGPEASPGHGKKESSETTSTTPP